MKRLAPILALLAFFTFAATQAQAQLNFYNGTPCSVRVLGSFNFSNNPCSTNYSCTTAWISCPPGQTTTIPGISTSPCLQPAPPAQANFRSIRVLTSSSTGSGASICSGFSGTVPDCQNTIRTVQMFNYNFAAIY